MVWAIGEPLATCARVFSSQLFSAATERLGSFLSHYPTLIGALAANLGFHLVEFGDTLQPRRDRFGCVATFRSLASSSGCDQISDLIPARSEFWSSKTGYPAGGQNRQVSFCAAPGSPLGRIGRSPGQPFLGSGEAAKGQTAVANGNALADASGVSRLRPECLHFVSRFVRPEQE
jgi:hypothetical protein